MKHQNPYNVVTRLALFGSIALSAGLAAWFTGSASAAPAKTAPNGGQGAPVAGKAEARIARGKQLVSTSGCHDCHTPLKLGNNGPEPDMSRALSGHPAEMQLPPPPAPNGPWIVSVAATNTAWAGPWGVSFTANLTPDAETGLGDWTAQSFIQTIRTGRHLGRGRPLLPPMPVAVYQNFSDDDLGAIFAYLQSLPATKNRVPDPVVPVPAAAPVKMGKK
jgi:mono/diheme cytochrome c family protein